MILNYDYKNNKGEYAPYTLVINDKRIINPTEEQYSEAGYYPIQTNTDDVSEVVVEDTKEEVFVSSINIEEEIAELKRLLAESDYKAIKYAEGHIDPELYISINAERLAWRDRINELEKLYEEI